MINKPRLPLRIRSTSGHDVYGQPQWGAWRPGLYAPVRLDFDVDNTTVRTDSSASHGHASERVAKVVILMTPNAGAREGDQIELQGRQLRVTGIHPRFDVRGRHDHDEIRCAAWV